MKSEVKLFAFLFVVLGLISVVSAYESQVYNFSASISPGGINFTVNNSLGFNVTNNTTSGGSGNTGGTTGGGTAGGGGGGGGVSSDTFTTGLENLSNNNSNTSNNPDFTPLNAGQSVDNATPSESTSSTPKGIIGLTGAVVGALTSTAGITSIVILLALGIGVVGFFTFKKSKAKSAKAEDVDSTL